MENLEVKFIIAHTGKWTQITVDSVEYVIKFDLKDGDDTLRSMSCWLSDFTSLWTEIVDADEIVERLKRCNPLLACKEMMTRILTKIITVPQSDNVQLTGLNDNEVLHLGTKHYLSDGSDQIPLKFFWSLEKGCSQSFYERFSKIMLLKIIDLEKTNDFLIETIRQKDEALNGQGTTPVGDKNGIEQDKDLQEINLSDVDLSTSTAISYVCHEGITCNNCGEDIFGHRYNCVECEDFDLCMACEHKEMQHTHHIMARYAQPNDKDRGESLFRGRTPHVNKRARSSRT